MLELISATAKPHKRGVAQFKTPFLDSGTALHRGVKHCDRVGIFGQIRISLRVLTTRICENLFGFMMKHLS
jgi:hypothetical protein